MINLDFLPSRQITFYMAKLFITRTFAVLIALVLVLMMLDLLGESGKILAVDGNTDADLWRYVRLRLPLLISQFLPFAALLGTLIAFTALNQNSEVISMKAAGLSAHQILAPLILTAGMVAAGLFVFNETIKVNSARVVTAWQDNDYQPVPPESGILSNVWIRSDSGQVHARLAAGTGDNFRLQDVSIYQLEDRVLKSVARIDVARPVPGEDRWTFEGIETYDADMNMVREGTTGSGLAGVTPSQFKLATVNPESTDILTLTEDIEALESAGRPTEAARAGWWHKITAPLSTLLMPLLASVAAFGLARSGQVLLRATIGMALGFAYFVADNFSLAMGTAGVYPPFLAAWGPVLLFFLIGESVLVRTEE